MPFLFAPSTNNFILKVRQSAGLTFGGLLKIGLFGDKEDIINTLKTLAVTPLPKGTKKSQTGKS